jgi:S-adenosyl methyltransferase
VNQVRPTRVPAGVDPAKPAPARIYDYLLSGENNFASDREAAERITAVVPEIKDCAWANRGFHQRAARWIARRGVRQFIDIGSGLPTVGNTHEVVQAVDPHCRVVYVDNDPMVREQASELLTNRADVRVVLGDLRDPDRVLTDPGLRALIDFSQPAGLLMTAVMHFVGDEWNPQRLLARYLAALAPGSYLSLSHLTDDQRPPHAVNEFRRVFDAATEQIHFRSRAEIERFFAGLKLVSPHRPGAKAGLSYAGEWGAVDPVLAKNDGSRWLYCGVGRRP